MKGDYYAYYYYFNYCYCISQLSINQSEMTTPLPFSLPSIPRSHSLTQLSTHSTINTLPPSFAHSPLSDITCQRIDVTRVHRDVALAAEPEPLPLGQTQCSVASEGAEFEDVFRRW